MTAAAANKHSLHMFSHCVMCVWRSELCPLTTPADFSLAQVEVCASAVTWRRPKKKTSCSTLCENTSPAFGFISCFNEWNQVVVTLSASSWGSGGPPRSDGMCPSSELSVCSIWMWWEAPRRHPQETAPFQQEGAGARLHVVFACPSASSRHFGCSYLRCHPLTCYPELLATAWIGQSEPSRSARSSSLWSISAPASLLSVPHATSRHPGKVWNTASLCLCLCLDCSQEQSPPSWFSGPCGCPITYTF